MRWWLLKAHCPRCSGSVSPSCPAVDPKVPKHGPIIPSKPITTPLQTTYNQGPTLQTRKKHKKKRPICLASPEGPLPTSILTWRSVRRRVWPAQGHPRQREHKVAAPPLPATSLGSHGKPSTPMKLRQIILP